jgi:hypothetical protein
MPRELKEDPEAKKTDPFELAVNTPDNKMGQFTIIPKGAVLCFSMCTVIASIGKDNNDNNENPKTQMEQLLGNIYTLSRSKDGVMLSKVMQIAETKVETQADEGAEAKKYMV